MSPRDWLGARRAAFGGMGEEYDRFRPSYPADALLWALGPDPLLVVDVGCGPGKLTRQLAEMGNRAIGLDPSFTMLRAMRTSLPRVRATAEAMPFRTGSIEAITSGQAFHWFDHARAVPEMRRILHPSGRIALLWNFRDESVEWVRELSAIIGSEDAMTATLGDVEDLTRQAVAHLTHHSLFTSVEQHFFSLEQDLDEPGLVGLVASRSYVAVLPKPERDRLLAAVTDLRRSHPHLRSRERFSLPYKTLTIRAMAADGG